MIDLRTLGTITSHYGSRTLRGEKNTHNGIDIVLKDTNIPFVLGGTVQSSGYHASKGNYVTVKQTDGTTATYMHMKFYPTWKAGDVVTEGAKVGVMGNTGNSTGPHLHYEVRNADGYIDPDSYFANYSAGDEDYISNSMTEVPDNGGNGYSILGNIVRFIVILTVCIIGAYLILKSFDIDEVN